MNTKIEEISSISDALGGCRIPTTAPARCRCLLSGVVPTDPSSTDHGPSTMQVVRDRSVAVYLVAATLSAIGMFLQAAALGKQVYDITDSEFALGMLGLVEFLPALLLLPLTGSAADRFDRRRIGAIGFGAEVLTSVLFCWYAATNPTQRAADLHGRRAVRHRPRVRLARRCGRSRRWSRPTGPCPG